MLAVAFIGWSFVGFESAGSIAEEVHEPRRYLPKAVLFSLAFIFVVVAYSSLAIILAIPDLAAVAEGAVADPVYETLTTALGHGVARPVEVMFVIGFLASFLALQTSASRVIWAYARDGGLPGSGALRKLSAGDRLPINAILLTGRRGRAGDGHDAVGLDLLHADQLHHGRLLHRLRAAGDGARRSPGCVAAGRPGASSSAAPARRSRSPRPSGCCSSSSTSRGRA